jgi:hypothetical protein
MFIIGTRCHPDYRNMDVIVCFGDTGLGVCGHPNDLWLWEVQDNLFLRQGEPLKLNIVSIILRIERRALLKELLESHEHTRLQLA